jgi:sugar phosphate permease
MPLFLTFLLFSYGWRGAYRILAVLTLTMLPVSWFLIKPHRPEYYGLLPDGEKPREEANPTSLLTAGQEYAQEVGEVEFTAREAYRTSSFWLMSASITLRYMIIGVVNVHTIPFLTDMGMDPIAAAKGLGLMVGLSLPGRFIGGTLSDKVDIQKIRYLFMFGLGGIAVHPLIPARYFGRKAYGTIDGTKTFIAQIGSIVAPIYAGWVYDTSGSYMNAFITLFALSLLAIVIMYFAKPPKPPATIT